MHVWFGRYSRTDLHTCDNKTAVVAVVVTFIILVISKTPSKHQKPNSSASEVSSIFIATEVCIKNQSQYTSINPSIHPFAFPPVHSSIHVFLHHIQGSVDSSLLSRAVLTQVFFSSRFFWGDPGRSGLLFSMDPKSMLQEFERTNKAREKYSRAEKRAWDDEVKDLDFAGILSLIHI